MALTLRSAVTANDTTFDVLGSDDLEAGDFKTIDSETVVIRSVRSATLAYGESPRYRVSVYRGSGGTRAASHAADASLAVAAAGGTAQTILRRDFTVNFDDAGVDDINTGVVLWTPVAGEVILDLWCYPVVQFAGGDSAVLYVGGNVWYDPLINATTSGGSNGPDLLLIIPNANGSDFLRPGSLNESNESLDARAGLLDASASDVIARKTGWVPTEVSDNGCSIIVAVTVTNGPMTAGQLAIRAVTATPA